MSKHTHVGKTRDFFTMSNTDNNNISEILGRIRAQCSNPQGWCIWMCALCEVMRNSFYSKFESQPSWRGIHRLVTCTCILHHFNDYAYGILPLPDEKANILQFLISAILHSVWTKTILSLKPSWQIMREGHVKVRVTVSASTDTLWEMLTSHFYCGEYI